MASKLEGTAKGAASGAALGSAILPGWGTAIGAAGGGLLGFLTSGGGSGSPQQQQDLEQQRRFRDQMLAAMQNQINHPMVSPQLGAASWSGARTPVAPGTILGGGGPSPVPPPVAAPPAAQAAMAAEIERIKQKRMLDAYGLSNVTRLPGQMG